MPIYEYKCDGCGKKFEKLMRSYDAAPPACPSCEGEKVTMQLSTFAAHSGGSSSSAGADAPPCASGMCPTPGMCGLN